MYIAFGLPVLPSVRSPITLSCADPEKNCQRGSEFVYLFIDRGIEDQNTAINGQSSAHQRNAIEMAFCWRSDDGPTLNAGLVAF